MNSLHRNTFFKHTCLNRVYCVLFSLVVITACGKQEINSQGLVYCSEGSPSSFNPQLDTSGITIDASSQQIYDRLLDIDAETGKIISGLASSWLVSEDGLTYSFQLRKDVTFHQTEYFTPTRNFGSQDVIFSFSRWRDTSHPFHQVNGGKYPYFDSVQLPSLIKDIVALNEHRIDIYLNRPDSSFLSNLATDFAVILSAEYAQNLTNTEAKERIDFFPVGTGPFKFQNYQSNRYIRYVRHEEYWGQPQSLSQLVYDITPSSSKRLAKLLTSECDVMSLPSYADLAVLQQKEVITYNQRSGLNVGFWAFNTSKKPFDNPKIRKALAMAIDKNAILETIYANTGTRAKGIIPPASWAYHAHIGDYSYNPVAARKLLAEANLSENFAMTIWAMPLQRHYNPDAIRMAELIRDYLSQVNITATIVSDEWTTFRKRLKAGVYDSVLIGWTADNSDPDNFFRTLLSCDAIQSGTNRARWCSEEYDDYINQAIQYSNTKDRNIFYEKASEIIQEQVPLVPIAHALHYQAFRSEVSGLRINPHGGIRFSGVGIDYRLSEK